VKSRARSPTRRMQSIKMSQPCDDDGDGFLCQRVWEYRVPKHDCFFCLSLLVLNKYACGLNYCIVNSKFSNSGPKKSQNEKHISYYTINFICHWKLIQNLAQNEKWLKIVLTKLIFAACSLQHGAGHGWPTGRSPQRPASRMDKQMMASAVASVQNNSKQLIFDLGISANCFLVVACLKLKTRLRFCCDRASFLYQPKSALKNMGAVQFWGARTDCFLEKQSNVLWNLLWRLAHHEKHSFCFTETKCELL